MATKQGDLRVQKRGVLYGPLTRAAMDRLLADGKLASSDLVSVRGGEWIEIAAFLVSSAEDAKEDADLRLLAEQRLFHSLSRRQLEQLRSAGRVDDDDLICALNGPWMRVGDFFAPPSTMASESSAAPGCGTPPIAAQAAGGPLAQTVGPPPSTPIAAAPADPWAPAAPTSDQLREALAPTLATITEVHTPSRLMSGLGAGYDTPPPVLPPGVWLSEIWFVRIRGMHSAPLKKPYDGAFVSTSGPRHAI